jgi:hypothetical protein
LVVVVGGFRGDLFVFSVAVGGFCVVVVICSDLRFLAVVRVEVVMVGQLLLCSVVGVLGV